MLNAQAQMEQNKDPISPGSGLSLTFGLLQRTLPFAYTGLRQARGLYTRDEQTR